MNVTEVARLELPTSYGSFQARAFESSSGFVHLALFAGDISTGGPVLTRVHSECLTGDALSSLRCDCGLQLHTALRAIASEGRGVLIYVTGHEGRGVGLINKLRSYVLQDAGADTVDANLHLDLPVDDRKYEDAASVLCALGIDSIRLLSNNPGKAAALNRAGLKVTGLEPLHMAAHNRNVGYLRTKRSRLGHLRPPPSEVTRLRSPDPGDLLGSIRSSSLQPYVVVKYAQSVDGRIATAIGDSKWISGEAERAVSHSLRARCDACMVGVGTVLRDDPQLTVRMVPGASPIRVVLDTTLRVPLTAKVVDSDAATVVLTTEAADQGKIEQLRHQNVSVRVLPAGPSGVDMSAALASLRNSGITSLLVEGGAKVITELLRAHLVDRLVVACAPLILGSGLAAVGDLGVARVAQGISLSGRSLFVMDDDVMMAWDVSGSGSSVVD
ncbi:MAG: GTP cyclohydrolase II [Actinomycetota bacterium]|nr:GTP cyclohydrolase II [Actinomycetota bacterium]